MPLDEALSRFDTPAMALIRSLNWPTVSEIVRSEAVTTMYKSLNGPITEYLSDLFEKVDSKYQKAERYRY